MSFSLGLGLALSLAPLVLLDIPLTRSFLPIPSHHLSLSLRPHTLVVSLTHSLSLPLTRCLSLFPSRGDSHILTLTRCLVWFSLVVSLTGCHFLSLPYSLSLSLVVSPPPFDSLVVSFIAVITRLSPSLIRCLCPFLTRFVSFTHCLSLSRALLFTPSRAMDLPHSSFALSLAVSPSHSLSSPSLVVSLTHCLSLSLTRSHPLTRSIPFPSLLLSH